MEEQAHGRLQRQGLETRPELRRFSEIELATELLSRLREARGETCRQATELLHIVEHDLCEYLEQRLDTRTNRWSVQLASESLRFPYFCYLKHGLLVAGAVHADMGCGSHNPMGRMFLHMMLGISEGLCIDLDGPLDIGKAVRHLARLAAVALIDPKRVFPMLAVTREEILHHLRDFDLAAMAHGDPGGISPRLVRLERSIVATGLADACVNVIFTNSVLEHLPDIPTLLHEWARITVPGGFGIHGIDTSDHRAYGDPGMHPLEFLADPAEGPIVHECNRLRPDEYVDLFAAGGFAVLEFLRSAEVAVDDRLRARLMQPWKSMSDRQLGTTWAQFLVKRN